MTRYERGQRDMQRRAAEVCTTIATDGSLTPGKEALPAVYCAERILSLPIVGEADQRGAAAEAFSPSGSQKHTAQSVPHQTPGEQELPAANSARRDEGNPNAAGTPSLLTSAQQPARPGPCVSVPVEPTEKMLAAGNRAYGEYQATHMTRSNAWNALRAVYAAMLAAREE